MHSAHQSSMIHTNQLLFAAQTTQQNKHNISVCSFFCVFSLQNFILQIVYKYSSCAVPSCTHIFELVQLRNSLLIEIPETTRCFEHCSPVERRRRKKWFRANASLWMEAEGGQKANSKTTNRFCNKFSTYSPLINR